LAMQLTRFDCNCTKELIGFHHQVVHQFTSLSQKRSAALKNSFPKTITADFEKIMQFLKLVFLMVLKTNQIV